MTVKHLSLYWNLSIALATTRSEDPSQKVDREVDEIDERRVLVNTEAQKESEKTTARSETPSQDR